MRRYLLAAGLFALFIGYAILRYVVFKGVDAAHIPLYVTNKAVALLAVALIGLSMVIGPLSRLDPDGLSGWTGARRSIGLAGFGAAVLHVLMTLPIFSPAYYGKFFAAPDVLSARAPGGVVGLHLSAELSLLAGALSMGLLVWQAALSQRVHDAAGAPSLHALTVLRRLGWGVLALVAAHCAFMGWSGWWPPASWPGRLPPITLLGVVIVGVVVGIRVGLRRRGRG